MPKRLRRTTIRVPGVRVADDLVDRAFFATAPNRLWCADIKFRAQLAGLAPAGGRDGLLQPPDRPLVDAARPRAEVVVDALEMAIARRRPKPGLVHHSDQGSPPIDGTWSFEPAGDGTLVHVVAEVSCAA